MKRLIVVFLMTIMSSIHINFISAQETGYDGHRLRDRISRLVDLCGEWKGQAGGEQMRMVLEMEESSSVIGELEKSGAICFIHCFAEDMVKNDNVTAGYDGDYEYCFLEQSGGETVGVFYMTCSDGVLKGIYTKDGNTYPAGFELQDSDGKAGYTAADPAAVEEDKWDTATYMATREAFEAYLAEFPSGKYANEAKGRLRLLEAFEAEAKGDHYGALSALDKAENHIPLTREALDLRAEAEEGIAYDRFALSETPEESIRNGMDFVNTYLRSSRRSEVSDRVAYLMASSPTYLGATSAEVMLTYATTQETREYVVRQTSHFSKEKYRKSRKSGLGFNGGIGVSMETPLESLRPIYGGHISFSVGDYRNFMNIEMGLRYRYWAFVNEADASDTFDFHQLRLFIAPKINLVRQKKSAFYMYVAPEASYGYPIDMHATSFYEANTLSFGGRVGLGLGRFELSACYAYDYWPMVNEDFTGSYSRTMAGVALTFCFSGSGR